MPQAEHPFQSLTPTRRDFLKRAGAGAVAVGSMAGAPVAAQAATGGHRTAKTPGVDYDVIVLGGGFAGVTAARDSMKNGYRTLLLEARPRLGGRTFTSIFAGHQVEMGGTWVHWSQPFVWAEIQRYKLDVIETPEANIDADTDAVVLSEGRRQKLEGEQAQAAFGAIARYFSSAGQMWERPYDAGHQWNRILADDKRSAADAMAAMPLTPLQRTVVNSNLSALGHCAPGAASDVDLNRWWALAGGSMQALHDAGGRYRFRDGTVSLIDKMVEDGKPEIRLSTPVRAVEDKGGHVVVTTARGERITAAAVMVALPMNVLPDVEFSPPLPAGVIAAGREKHVGQGIKLLVKVKGRLSRSRVLALADPAQHPLPIAFTYAAADDHTVLVAFGPDPKRIDYSDKVAVQAALGDFFPQAEVEALHFQPWTEDPYSQGTWCNYRPGWFGKYYSQFQQDQGRVIFGQGDHGEGWRGFIDGAIGAGARAAERLKRRFG
ncbi:MAG: flavin monoamine oxidase family protein [Cupriavidus necator]